MSSVVHKFSAKWPLGKKFDFRLLDCLSRERQAKVRDREKIMCVRTDRQTAIWKMFANFRHKYNLVDLNTHLKEKLYTNTYKKNSLQ